MYSLTPSRRRLGKAVARSSKSSIAKACFTDPITTKYAMNYLGTLLRREIQVLVSHDTNSMLQSQDIRSMETFTWDVIMEELRLHAPKLLILFQAITETKQKDEHKRNGIIGMCVSILLKYRLSRMSLVQKIISVIIYAGHASKQVC